MNSGLAHTFRTVAVLGILIGFLQPALAETVRDKLCQKPGRYVLDKWGSSLEIQTQGTEVWALTVTRHRPNTKTSATPGNALKSKGWFVLIENPERIWVFDGEDGGMLIEHTREESKIGSISWIENQDCPDTAVKALPKRLQKVRRNQKTGAN